MAKKKPTRADLNDLDLAKLRRLNRTRIARLRATIGELHEAWREEPMSDSYFDAMRASVDQLEADLGEWVDYYAEAVD